jgi:hypothetical protein
MVPGEELLFLMLEADREPGRFYECSAPVFLLEA